MSPWVRLAAAPIALALLVPACGGGDSKVAISPTPTTPPTSPPPCATPAPTRPVWPKEVPTDLPKPAGAVIEKTEYTQSGVFVVRFNTPSSLREGILFILKELPAKGYVLGRGDAESFEADAPFQKAEIRGLLKMLASAPCKTLWLIAIGNASGFRNGPPFATRPPSSTASPLPFG